MKIYRYMYKNKEIKVDEFECEKKSGLISYCIQGCNDIMYDKGIFYEVLNDYNSQIKENELDKVQFIGFFSFYIIWSLNSDKKEIIKLFIEGCNKQIEFNCERIKDHEENINELKKDIERLKEWHLK